MNMEKANCLLISDYAPEINALKATMPGLSDEDFVKWREEKLQYLRSLKQEPQYDMQDVAYVEALKQ